MLNARAEHLCIFIQSFHVRFPLYIFTPSTRKIHLFCAISNCEPIFAGKQVTISQFSKCVARVFIHIWKRRIIYEHSVRIPTSQIGGKFNEDAPLFSMFKVNSYHERVVDTGFFRLKVD